MCDVMKQNELELANDFKILPNKADDFFVTYCFCNPLTDLIFGTNCPNSMGSVAKVALQMTNTINQKNQKLDWLQTHFA